jgi:hypothetical protein
MTRSLADDGGVRCLSLPDEVPMPRTNVVPKGNNRQSVQTRDTLGQFLDATLMRPLWFSEEQQNDRVNEAMETMTIAERIAIELEIQARAPTVHTFDYDPLK